MEVLEEAFAKISQEEMVMDETYKDDEITGTITTLEDNRTILTTIPYDAGWEVYVDGVRVETQEAVDALISFEITDAGEHDIRFLYRPATFKIGIAVTIASSAIFVLIIIFEKYLKKLWVVKTIFVVEYNEDLDNVAEKNDIEEKTTPKLTKLKKKK